jgi:hypothetical protein
MRIAKLFNKDLEEMENNKWITFIKLFL